MQDLVEQYRTSDDDGRERLFAGMFESYYNGDATSIGDVSAAIEDFLSSLMSQSSTGGEGLDLETAFQELYSVMQFFCFGCPVGLDYAWVSTIDFINTLKRRQLAHECNVYRLAVDGLEYWVAENASGDPCSLNDNQTATRPTDPSVLHTSEELWNQDPAKQLSKLTSNRLRRKDSIVSKVILARALRNGYASTTTTSFKGALELRFIEIALLRSKGELLFNGHCQSSADVVAATFLLRACAKSL